MNGPDLEEKRSGLPFLLPAHMKKVNKTVSDRYGGQNVSETAQIEGFTYSNCIRLPENALCRYLPGRDDRPGERYDPVHAYPPNPHSGQHLFPRIRFIFGRADHPVNLTGLY